MKNCNEIKAIEFLFENCESFTIKKKYFGDFRIGGITFDIARAGSNSICKTWRANEIVMEIFREGNKAYVPFGGLMEDTLGEDTENKENEGCRVKCFFDRISWYDDIAAIDVIYQDGHREEYYTDYDEERVGLFDTRNRNQKCLISTLGNLYLVIEEGKEIADAFDLEEINSQKEMDFKKDMCFRIEEEGKKKQKCKKKKNSKSKNKGNA